MGSRSASFIRGKNRT